MREIIDYSKNFLSGETIERKRNKDDLNYRGIATVQLFDEKGNMVQEVKSENCINKRWLSYLYKSFFRTNLIYNAGATLYSTQYFYGSPAQNIVLTDNADEENDMEIPMKGKIVGWANGWKEYIGNDSFRGSVNKAETTDAFFRKHFVIDFPTNAANGTFQSIYWYGGKGGDIKPIYGMFKEDSYIVGDKDYTFTIMNNYLYGMDNSTKPGNFYKIDLTNFKIIRSIVNDDKEGTYRKVGRYQDKIYFFTEKYANVYDENLNFISRINIKPLDSSKNFKLYTSVSFDEGFIIIDSGSNCSLYDGELNEIRAINGSAGITSYTFYIGDGIFCNPSSYSDSGPISYYNIHKDEKVFDIYGTNYYAWIDRLDNYSSNDSIKYSGISMGSFCYDLESKKLYYLRSYNSAYYYTMAVRIPWFSHTLLPSPVTKAATNTMKIQYDFVVEERGYFD